ncbi:MAG: DUF2332 family protein [Candidatus Heimdallarchaeota archaeon]|nr:DUF2332 family protein [Candidatus Heimdallarchaeota archaeon]
MINPYQASNQKLGIDINLLDVLSETDSYWLKSLLWPSKKDRSELIEKAIDFYQTTPAQIIIEDNFGNIRSILQD